MLRYRIKYCGSLKFGLFIGLFCILAIIHTLTRSIIDENNYPNFDYYKLTLKSQISLYYKMRRSNRSDRIDREESIESIRSAMILSKFDDSFSASLSKIAKKNYGESATASILENLCKFPKLSPEDETLKPYVKHVRELKCRKVQDEIILFDRSSGVLSVNRLLLEQIYGSAAKNSVLCQYRPFEGTLRPFTTTIEYNPKVAVSFRDQSPTVTFSQVEVNCSIIQGHSKGTLMEIYRSAFAQISPKNVENCTLLPNSENDLSLDIIGIDSTALNMFRRHMPASWRYMTETMGFLHLEAYNKVADNSMVNWVPVLLGKRYLNQSEDMLDELQSPDGYNKLLELEEFDWLWKKFERKGCATMMNDDPMHFARGLFHYPWQETAGFRFKPTDYYFRPWHVYHRLHAHPNASQFCFNNRPYYEPQLALVEEMIKKFQKTCHFSFSFLTDLTHDDPNNLELMDDFFHATLSRLYAQNYLNNTVLVVMGDHGHRIGAIQYSYAGRIEERAPLFSAYFPAWFRRKFAPLIDNFRINKFRLTSNYDVYQTFQAILNGKLDTNPKPDPSVEKGASLFSRISPNRTCRQAQVPDNHCLCMIRASNAANYSIDLVKRLIVNHTIGKLPIGLRQLCNHATLTRAIKISNVTVWTTTQMVQHGIRRMAAEVFPVSRPFISGDLEFIEVNYAIGNVVEVLARIQNNKIERKLSINIPPLVVRSNCSRWNDPTSFCACSAYRHLS